MRKLPVFCVAWLLAASSAAFAQSESPGAIAAQPLARALSEFATRTGLQLVYVSVVVESMRSGSVPAGLPPAEALARLLRGTGLTFEFLNARTVRIFNARAHPGREAGNAGAGESARLEEVIVTAMHQAEWASQVPISLTVWSQEAMTLSGVKGITEFAAMTPGLNFDWRSNIGAGTYTTLDMRGVTGRHGVSTGIFIDDTPIPSVSNDSYGRSFPATFDLERVEILRGAQGMLLGQGTLGGAIRFITQQPSLTAFSGLATAEWATTAHGGLTYEAGAAAGGPLIDDVLGMRVSGWYRSQGGFIDRLDPLTFELVERDSNRATGESGRIALAWMPADSTRITSTLIYDANRADDTSSYFLDHSDPAKGDFRISNVFLQPRYDRFYLATLKLEHWSDATDFIAVSSYHDRRNWSIHDLTCLEPCGIPQDPDAQIEPFAFVVRAVERMFAQELRLASADAEATYTWLVGAHYSRVDGHGRVGDVETPTEQHEGSGGNATQVEGYAQLTRRFGPRVTASAGARIGRSSYDSVTALVPPVRNRHSEWAVTPRFDLSYHGEGGGLVFLTAAEGYRSANIVAAIPGCEPLALAADTVWNFELGAKGDLLAGRAHVEASVFNARWHNRQREVVVSACLTAFQAGRAESSGFELTGQAPIGDRATVGVGLSYIDARYTQSVMSDGIEIVRKGDAVQGARLPWSVSAFVSYELPPVRGARLTLRAEDYFRGGNMRRRTEDNPQSPLYQAFARPSPSTNFLNLRADARWGRADLAVFVNNVLDSGPILNRFGDCCVDNFSPLAYTLTPRTVGLSANWQF